MPILILASMWTYVLWGVGAAAGLITTGFGFGWLSKKLNDRSAAKLRDAMSDAYIVDGRDGLKRVIFEKKMAQTDDHAEILTKHFEELVRNDAEAKKSKRLADKLEKERKEAQTAHVKEAILEDEGPETPAGPPVKIKRTELSTLKEVPVTKVGG